MKKLLVLLSFIWLLSISLCPVKIIALCEDPKMSANVRMNSRKLSEEATHIVLGEVEAIRSEWDEEENMIYSNVDISVEDYLKGSSEWSHVTVKHKGGEMGDVGVYVSGEPRFTKGERVKVFLRSESPDTFSVVGGGEGKISLSQPCSGYDHIGLHWNPDVMPIGYEINVIGTPDCYQEFNCIIESFETWVSDPQSFIEYTFSGYTGEKEAYDGRNVVSWDYLDGPGGTLAYCVTWYSIITLEIEEFDITFDEFETWSDSGEEDKFDIRQLGTHEIGHSLGLNDLYDPQDRDETMYGSEDGLPGQTYKRTLYVGDVAGLRFIYGDSGGKIYWDVYHDTDGDSIGAGGRYEELADELRTEGYTVDERNVQIDSESLIGYDVLVVLDPETPLSSSEMSAIQTWVDVGGHGLLVVGDTAGEFDATSINSLLSPYGVSISDSIYPDTAFSFYQHGITLDVIEIDTSGCGVLTVVPPSIELGLADWPWRCILSAYGAHPPSSLGGVVVLSDSDVFDNTHLHNYDNLVLTFNVFKWLSQLTPTLINVDTERLVYWPGDTMRLGLEIINLGDRAWFNGGVLICLEMPGGGKIVLVNKPQIAIPPGYEYVSTSWRTFIIPNGASTGSYIWHSGLYTRESGDRIIQNYDKTTFYIQS
jgi:hypothetical protein